MNAERFIPPEARESPKERAERERREEVQSYINGLKEALADPNLADEERVDLEEQLAGLEESLEEAIKNNRKVYE